MAAEAPTFEYHVEDWWPTIKPVDLIPVVGFFLPVERGRKERGESLAEAYLPWKSGLFQQPKKEVIADLVSLGVAHWPEPTNRAANLRSQLMAARNGGFLGYHGLMLLGGLIYGPEVIQAVTSLLQR